MFNLIVFLLLFSVSAWSQSSGSGSPSFLMNGGATLATNFVEKGLTQTEGDPNLQGEFWFNFGPQFRLGLWGSNVRYEDASTSHFWLKLNGDIKVDFSGQTNMIIKYSMNKYYKSNNRDGNLIGIHFTFGTYKIIYDMDSNWEGSSDPATYFGVGKASPVGGDYIWTNMGGYTMPKVSGITAYFDVRSSIGKKFRNIFADAGISYANASGSIKDRAAMAIIFSAAVQY